MKRSNVFLPALFLSLILPSLIFSQSISIYKMIDLPMDAVIKQYGKPAHQDNSNPSMRCVFYKTKTTQIVFVADKTGVYQIEYSCDYNSMKSAGTVIGDFIQECYTEGFKVDTLNVQEFNFTRKGTKMNLSLLENKYANNYKVIVKANRSGF